MVEHHVGRSSTYMLIIILSLYSESQLVLGEIPLPRQSVIVGELCDCGEAEIGEILVIHADAKRDSRF